MFSFRSPTFSCKKVRVENANPIQAMVAGIVGPCVPVDNSVKTEVTMCGD